MFDRGSRSSRKATARAIGLYEDYQRTGNFQLLQTAIILFSEAVDATPPGHRDRPGYLSNLGAALQIRFEHAGQPSDLDQAIDRFAEVIGITPADHPGRPMYLSNLGHALRTRFERTGEQADLDQAITIGRQAVDTAPADHPNRPGCLSNLGYALRIRFERAGEQADLDQAIDAYREGAGVATASPGQRAVAAQAWGGCALLAGTPGIAVEAYAAAIDLLPLVAWHGLDQATREHHLREWTGLASDAAAAAVAANDPARAVELLEAGRSILWTQVSQLRHDLAALRERAPDLAAALEASRAVLNSPSARVPGDPDATGDAGEAQAAEQQMLDARRQAARDWDAAVGEVRRIEGFEHFPRPAPVTDLGATAAAGAVAIVNISQHGSHALIVARPSGPGSDPEVRVVDLPAASVDTVIAQGNALLAAQRRTSDPAADRHAVFSVLDWSWQAVTEPVLADLGHTCTPQERIEDWPRVWWCPTGPATVIPLHAAGRHPRTAAQYLAMGEAVAVADSVAGRVISSYTSTLAALTQARTRPAPGQVRQLAVGMPEAPSYAPGASPLPAVRRELLVLGRYLPAPEHATHLVGPAATQQAVLAALPGHSWLHLSCHGAQHPDDPSRSAFLLHDQPLTLADLAALDLHEMDLANLSACQTARGDLRLLDEALHLAGALHLVGYRHVLATMWSIADATATAIADITYAHLLHHDPDAPGPNDQPQAARAPYALHQAITGLRQRYPGEPLLWAPYIHLGP